MVSPSTRATRRACTWPPGDAARAKARPMAASTSPSIAAPPGAECWIATSTSTTSPSTPTTPACCTQRASNPPPGGAPIAASPGGASPASISNGLTGWRWIRWIAPGSTSPPTAAACGTAWLGRGVDRSGRDRGQTELTANFRKRRRKFMSVWSVPGGQTACGTGGTGAVAGISARDPGFLAMMAGIDPHPAVKAISPQAPMIDVWMGDDFFHNGAFRQSYGYDYVLSMESSKEEMGVSYGRDKDGKPVDGFDYFLKRSSFAADVKESGSKVLPTWKLFLDHPAYDSYWSSRGVEQALNAVTVPTLSVGGYYDQEDMYGPQEEYARLEPHDAGHENFLVLGPWRHGYWNSSTRHLGNLDYGEPIGTEFRARIEAKFFAHFLKDEAGFDLEDTASFETGSNTDRKSTRLNSSHL